MNKFLICLMCLGWGLSSVAQNGNLTGTVQDTRGSALESASVVLLNPMDSLLVDFGLTGKAGEFEFLRIDTGTYLLQVSYLGYGQYSSAYRIRESETETVHIILEETSATMQEIVIEGERAPMMVRNDTLVYNADAFKVQPNDVVEDLLRKLPGIEVEQDGNIKAQGEDVQQVLVDGKEFFGDDPKIATRNLPADAVSKVEVYDKKSEAAEFSGVDDGEREKTINLELKEDRKSGVFGTLSGGYGTEDRYMARASVNRFSGKMQVSGIGSFNNVNEQGFSWGEAQNFFGTGGRGGSMMGGMNISSGMSDGFVETEAGGINFNYFPGSKTDISASYFMSSVESLNIESIERENFLEEGNFITEEDNNQSSDNRSHSFRFKLEHEIDSTQDLQINANLALRDNDFVNTSLSRIYETDNTVENELDVLYLSEGNNENYSGTAAWRKKLGSNNKSTLTFRANLNSTSDEYLADLNTLNEFFPDDPLMSFSEMIAQQQLQSNDMLNYALFGSYVRPLSEKQYIEFRYDRRNFNDDISREVYDELQGMLLFNDSLSSEYIRKYNYDRATIAWHINTEKSQLTVEGSFQNSDLDGDIISEGFVINKDVRRFLPRLRWRYEFAQSHSMRLDYSTSVNEPSLTQLQPIVDNTDPQNIVIGNPDLVPEYRHNMRVSYVNYDQFNFRSLFAYLNLSYTRNNITNQTIKELGRQVRQSVNVDYALNASSTISYNSPFRPLNLNYNMRLRTGLQNGPIFINGRENIRNNYNGSLRASLENRDKAIIDWRVGGSWGFNYNTYSQNESQNQSFFNRNLFADIIWTPSELWAFQTGIDVNFYSGESFTDEQTVPIWKASLSRYILKDQKGEIRLSVFDLLNQNLGIYRESSLNYVENREVLSLSRYFMLNFSYAIRK